MAEKKKKENGKLEAVAMKPMMHVEDDDCIDGLDVGKEVTLTVKAKCVGNSIDSWNGKEHRSQRFEILGVEKSDGGKAAKMAKMQKYGKGVAQ